MVKRILLGQRTDHHLTGTIQARTTVEGNLSRYTGLTNKQLVKIVHAIRSDTVDRDDIIARLSLNTRLLERRTQLLAPRGTRQDLLQTEEPALIPRDLRAQQAHRYPLAPRHLARINVSMTNTQLADQLADHVVQVETCLYIR